MEYKYLRTVNYYETDKMGITHHSNYIRFMEEARVAFMGHIGYSYAKCEADGLSSPVMGISCSYKSPSTFADDIEVTLNVLEMTPLKMKFGYTMKVKDKVVFTAESLHCFLDAKTGRPVRLLEFYPEVGAILEQYMPGK